MRLFPPWCSLARRLTLLHPLLLGCMLLLDLLRLLTCGAAPSAVFARRYSFLRWLADVPVLLLLQFLVILALAARLACPVAADISGRLQGFQCLAA